MASAVVSDNFETSTGAIPSLGGSSVTHRLCSAWVNFDGSLASASMIKSQFNVSSISDLGTGKYWINFLSAMPSANYAVTSGVFDGTTGQSLGTGHATSNNKDTTRAYCEINGTLNFSTNYDATDISIVVFSN